MADETTPSSAPAEREVSVTQVDAPQQVQLDSTQPPAKEPSDEQRPEGLPEGFSSWEEFGKAQLAKATEEPNADNSPAELTPEQQEQVKTELEQFPEEARERAKPFVEEVARTGTLSQEAREEAAKAFNVPVAWVDQFIAGGQDGAQAVVNPIFEAVGGEDVFKAFQEYAEANYTPEQKAAFNEGLTADKAKDTVLAAVQAWKEGGNGPAPRDITRDRAGSSSSSAVTGPTPYASQQQMTADMADPRYARDPAFRAEVEKRVAVSDFGNIRAM